MTGVQTFFFIVGLATVLGGGAVVLIGAFAYGIQTIRGWMM